jgi:cell division septal protein FtsQ
MTFQPHSMVRDYRQDIRPRRSGRGRTGLSFLSATCKLLLVLAATAGLGLGAVEGYKRFVHLPYFQVAEIRVDGNLQVATQEIVAGLRLPPKASLLELDLPALSRRLQENPWIKEAWVLRRLPISLNVRVVERVPEAVFIADRRYLLSADGVILTELTDDDLPMLPTLRAAQPQRVRPGARVLTGEMAQGLAVWRQFQAANALQGEQAHEIAMAGDGSYIVNLGQQMPAIRLHAADLGEQLRRLGAALAINGQALQTFVDVDLRYRDRVIFRLARGR